MSNFLFITYLVVFTVLIVLLLWDLNRIVKELNKVKHDMWELRFILAGKAYGVLSNKGKTIRYAFYTTVAKGDEFSTKFYSSDNSETKEGDNNDNSN